jgi:tripartite-type tricarboxylate transporter receptor subunit TctC
MPKRTLRSHARTSRISKRRLALDDIDVRSLREGAMKLARRKFLHLAASSVALPAVSRVATAQTYPSRPITMIVPFPAGGATDTIGRVVAERMGRYLRQAVIIENVSGAEGSIGIGRAARARADGYVIDLGQAGPRQG